MDEEIPMLEIPMLVQHYNECYISRQTKGFGRSLNKDVGFYSYIILNNM